MAQRIMQSLPDIRRMAAFPALCAACWMVLAVLTGVAVQAKPLPPVTVMWQLGSESASGDYPLEITLTAASPVEQVHVVVLSAPGVWLPEGGAERLVSLEAGEPVTLTFHLPPSEKGPYRVRVSGQTASNVHFARTIVVHVPEKSPIPGVPPEHPAELPPPLDGVREYPSR